MIQPARNIARSRPCGIKVAPSCQEEVKPHVQEPCRTFCSGRYEYVSKLGEGSYGEVYKVNDKDRSLVVALKKVKFQGDKNQGIPQSSLRELAVLKELDHDNIIKLYDIVQSKEQNFELFLSFEMADMDLRQFIHNNSNTLSKQKIKSVMKELLNGVNHMHSKRIIHRDLKPENILVSRLGEQVKVADFGLSRTIHNPLRPYSREILSLWYRSPELCMGYKHYSIGVDTWALGCIFYELTTGKPLFKEKTDTGMLFKIFELFGTPTDENWSWVTKITGFNCSFPVFQAKGLRSLLPGVEEAAIDLMSRLLALNPLNRMTCVEALNHPYFQ